MVVGWTSVCTNLVAYGRNVKSQMNTIRHSGGHKITVFISESDLIRRRISSTAIRRPTHLNVFSSFHSLSRQLILKTIYFIPSTILLTYPRQVKRHRIPELLCTLLGSFYRAWATEWQRGPLVSHPEMIKTPRPGQRKWRLICCFRNEWYG
jgi:hypothetical protein